MSDKKIELDNSSEELHGKGESLRHIYWRRFKKHSLGKIGAVILIVLYTIAFLADFLSPFDMTWTDKKKSYHPPTTIYWSHEEKSGESTFRPFVYEKKMTNAAFKTYSVIPDYSLRVVSIEKVPEKSELRVLADQKSSSARTDKIIRSVANYYSIRDKSKLDNLKNEISLAEKSPLRDYQKRLSFNTTNKDGVSVDITLVLAKGNKNFVKLFGEGVPYSFLGLFTTNTHFFTSVTGGCYFLGADSYGRDVLSRLMHGSRISLSVGLIGATITFFIGLLVGGTAGYFGGKTDMIIMRSCEIIIAFPALYLLFALRGTFPPSLSSIQVYILIVVILSFIGWAGLARIIRGLVLSLRNEEYVLCARSMGLSHFKIIWKHILPNTLSFVIIQVTLSIPFYILGESSLSLLGLGITDPQASWGLMLSVSRNIPVMKNFPWILSPGVLIFFAIIAWNFFGDGIRDAVDPRSRH